MYTITFSADNLRIVLMGLDKLEHGMARRVVDDIVAQAQAIEAAQKAPETDAATS